MKKELMNAKDAPCRFFRKGDEVRVVEERAGRITLHALSATA